MAAKTTHYDSKVHYFSANILLNSSFKVALTFPKSSETTFVTFEAHSLVDMSDVALILAAIYGIWKVEEYIRL